MCWLRSVVRLPKPSRPCRLNFLRLLARCSREGSLVRLSDFWERLTEVVGPAYTTSWGRDMVLPEIGLTVEQAIEAGVETAVIWRAVCECAEVPPNLR
jgi:hypothetical protein